MKTCKTGCGKMKAGGSVKKVKKMAKGGSSDPCPDGYHTNDMGGCSKNMFHSLGSKIGVGVIGSGMLGVTGKMIGDAIKRKKEAKKAKEESEKKKQEIKRKGGMAKMAKGGYAPAQKGGDNVKMGIYGMSNAGTTGPNRTAGYDYKKGGAAKAKFGASTPVKASCKNGMVRGADGNCVMSRPKFKSGGSFGMLSVKAGIDKNPKPTAADRIAGAKMNKKKMGSTAKRK